MTVKELVEQLELSVLAGEEGLSKKVEGCYIGDLLSWVMGRAEAGNAWITVMGNVNAIAVAKLSEASCIILCEGASLDLVAKAQADANGVAILSSEKNAYELACAFGQLLGQ